ncbi:MAG: aldolase/citrate lyase family protein, partial [Spirochaetota bacterium]
SCPNRLRQKLENDLTVWGTVIWEFPYASTAEIFAQSGFDWVWIDMEHSCTSLESITAFLRTSQPLGLTTLVRVPDAEYHLIARTLDCGVSGIIVPRVSDRATAELIVAASRYPPMGRRGVGFHSLNCSDNDRPLTERLERLNQDIMVVVQIETSEALSQLEEILSVPGIDAVLVGPVDLSVSLGTGGQFEHPEILTVLKRIKELSRKYSFVVGCHYDSFEFALRAAQRGARMVSVANDAQLMREGCSYVLRQLLL